MSSPAATPSGTAPPSGRPFLVILLCGALVVSLAMGVRQSFGLIIGPLSAQNAWPVATFSFALAVQNLLWGAAQPFASALAERWGAHRVAIAGGVTYAAGLALTAWGNTAGGAFAGTGILIGLALSGTTFGTVLGVIGRAAPPEKRSMALGIASAGGSFGQMAVIPVASGLIASVGVVQAMLILAVVALLMVPLALALTEPSLNHPQAGPTQSMGAAIRGAWNDRSFQLLTLGFFVCGFQVAFVGVHLPNYLALCHMPPALGATALMIIGGFNIIGSWGCGVLGQSQRPRKVLSLIYLLRGIVVALFITLPTTEVSVILFAASMGLLWLGTVPLTSQIIATLYGTRYMGTLFGIVFFSHQIGSFTGVWAGGLLFDATGSYDLVWWGSIGLGVVAAVLHLPIADARKEQAVPA